MTKTVLITGANRGLGLEFTTQLSAQGIQVIGTCRDPQQAKELQQLAKDRKNISVVKLDITDDQSIQELATKLKNKPLDWLINNAGISDKRHVAVGNIDRDSFLAVFNSNCVSALKVSEAFLLHLEQGQEKLIVVISSRMGSIGEDDQGGDYAYRASKAALNCTMKAFALDIANKGVNVLLLHPGWVRTDMGGPNADIDMHTSITGMLKVIEKHKNNSHAEGLYSYDGTLIGW